MKFMNQAILRRSASDQAVPQVSSHTNSAMTIDLADPDSLPALRALRRNRNLQRQVQTATVNAASCVWYGEVKMDFHALIEVFYSLSELPCLQSVSVDLSHFQIPVAALSTLLQGASSLKELQLIDLNLVGPVEDLERALRSHTQLVKLRLVRCQGAAVQSFMTELPFLKRLELRHTNVGLVSNASRNPWVVLGTSASLQSLTVQEVPDLKTEHILAFTNAFAAHQVETNSKLHELHFSSLSAAVDGQQCASAISDLLALYPQSNIKTLTLKFGTSWKTAGSTSAMLLRECPNITSLCIQLMGKNITDPGLEIFKALEVNSTLKRLKICLDRDQQLDDPLDQAFLEGLETALQSYNHVLQSVGILDENREKYHLPSAIRQKLELNTSGLPNLLHNGSCCSHESASEAYIRAMIKNKDNLDVLFYALSNQPEILMDLSEPSMKLLSSQSPSSSTEVTADCPNTKDKLRRKSAKARLMKFWNATA